jgi:hypothetical protein
MFVILSLQVPGLKPRAAEMMWMVESLEQKDEFSLATSVAETGRSSSPVT